MNTFGLDINQLDEDEAKDTLSASYYERLPGVQPFLSKKECATVLGVSMKVINQLTDTGELPLIDIPSDAPTVFDLFGNIIGQPREVYILRAELVKYMEKSLLCNKPVL